jgi:hypothetical protein
MIKLREQRPICRRHVRKSRTTTSHWAALLKPFREAHIGADSAIFVVEDDAANGVDHVDGHRSPAFVIRPYARRGLVDHNYYTQINVVRTIEQILGLPPMNQNDLVAKPMRTVFTDIADLEAIGRCPMRFGWTR